MVNIKINKKLCMLYFLVSLKEKKLLFETIIIIMYCGVITCRIKMYNSNSKGTGEEKWKCTVLRVLHYL